MSLPVTVPTIQQPSSGTWLKLADINGHLLLITALHRLDTKFDQLKGADVEFAEFSVVDLDAARPAEETVLDSHIGVVSRIRNLKPGSAILGRIAQVPSKQGQPAWVLAEFVPGVDDARAIQWLATQPGGSRGAGGTPNGTNTGAATQFPPPARTFPAGAAPAMPRAATSNTAATPAANQAEIDALRAQLAGLQST